MTKHYQSISIDSDLIPLIDNCETIYREHHRELDMIPLSKSKIIFEIIVFYLQSTKFKVKK